MFKTEDKLLKNYKWGLLFFTDNTFMDLLIRASIKGKTLNEGNGFLIGQGVNTTKDNYFINQGNGNIPIFTTDNGALLYWNKPLVYVSKKAIATGRKIPVLILPRGIGSRYYCALNKLNGFSSSCVDIYCLNSNEDNILKVWLFCNSTFCSLLRESSGRKNLGGGMLKAEATDLKYLPLLYNFQNIEEIKHLIKMSEGYEVPNEPIKALNDDIHKKIDDIVFNYLEFSKEEQEYVKSKFIQEVSERNNKSKTKRK